MNPTNDPQPLPEIPVASPWGRFHWTVLGAALLGPPVLTTLAAMLDRNGAAAPAMMFLGSAAGGLVAGVMLGCRFGRSAPTKVVLSLLLVGVSTVAVVCLSGFGCAVGGYQLNIH
ncbi:MAG: hypothetical protein IT580_14280 [Verrucomicrobiales bacterium]|nr:hypothetical protein [Verrucomicrobiales bacterium]